jgi:dTDP-4-amino-4,6-dideoxygalactose transaminase
MMDQLWVQTFSVIVTILWAGIGTLIHYPIPPHFQQAYAAAGYVKGQFPIAEQIANRCLSLPIGPHLGAYSATQVVAACTSAAAAMV